MCDIFVILLLKYKRKFVSCLVVLALCRHYDLEITQNEKLSCYNEI